jgi:hypothetical protein
VQAEALEDKPAMVLTVRNAQGKVVRQIEGPVAAGFHRVAWDLRYPIKDPWVPPEERGEQWQTPAGVLVAPGSYSVTLGQRVDGKLRKLGQRQTFEVYSIREPVLPGSDQQARVDFALQVDELKRRNSGAIKAIAELQYALGAIRESLLQSTAPPELYARTVKLSQHAARIEDQLRQNEERDKMGDPGPVPVAARLDFAGHGARQQAYGPTPAQERSLQIASEEFARASGELDRLLGSDYQQLLKALDAAAVPWTPGRGLAGPDPGPGRK